jgi:hypothetical protein
MVGRPPYVLLKGGQTGAIGDDVYRVQFTKSSIALAEGDVDQRIHCLMVLQPELTDLTPVSSKEAAYEKAVRNKNQRIANRYVNPTTCFRFSLYAISSHPAPCQTRPQAQAGQEDCGEAAIGSLRSR